MSESLSTLFDLFSQDQFRWGVALGALGLATVAVIGLLGGRAPWGLIVAVAVVTGLPLIDDDQGSLVGEVAVLAAGGWLIDRRWAGTAGRVAPIAGWVTVAAGAALIGLAVPDDATGWIAPAAVLVTLGFGALLARWSDDAEAAWLGPIFAITAFGAWTTVPDTELARLLLGVAAVMSVGTVRPLSGRVTGAGAFALAGVVAWLPAVGGVPRPASIIGAWACAGVIGLLPIVRYRWPDRSVAPMWRVVALHAGVAVVGARVIGLWTWAIPAVLASAALFAATFAALASMSSSEGHVVRR